MSNSEPNKVQLSLSGDGVVAPALRAIRDTLGVINFCLNAIESGDLTKSHDHEGSFFNFKFNDSNVGEPERRYGYKNWLLLKAFQELARGIRLTLEEAHFFNCCIQFITTTASPITWGVFEPKMNQFRSEAQKLNFPDLLQRVSDQLASPLHFEKEFLSFQKVRNCLEHRDGIVSNADVDPVTGLLLLQLPHLKTLVERNGEEIEVGKHFYVNAGEYLLVKNIIETREYRIGERILFAPEDVHKIAWGCWAFVTDLGSKLPTNRLG